MAGLESGIAGGLLHFAWMTLAAAFTPLSMWEVSNLLASVFYGPDAVRHRFAATTFSGLALHFLVSAALGMLFAVVMRDSQRRGRALLAGIMTGLVWYHAFNTLGWRTAGPAIFANGLPGYLLAAHVIFGIALGSYPRRLEALRRVFAPPETVRAAEPEARDERE